MIVYHTSDREIREPLVSFARPALDFGKGFYVTILREQAVRYGQRFILRGLPAVLNTYELLPEWASAPYNVIRFNAYDEAWLDFFMANRQELPVPSYDAVEGGVANDRIFRTLDLYMGGDIDKEGALRRLRFETPNHQICLLSQELTANCLRFVSSEKI